MHKNIEGYKENEKFYRECDKILQEKSFDEKLRQEMYKAYKEIPSKGKCSVCLNCMCCDVIKGLCIAPRNIEARMKHCYTAKKIYLLKKLGLYGQKKYH